MRTATRTTLLLVAALVLFSGVAAAEASYGDGTLSFDLGALVADLLGSIADALNTFADSLVTA